MKPRAARGLAWSLAAFSFATGTAALAMSIRNLSHPLIETMDFSFVISVSAAAVGVVVATRRPDHPIGWILLAMGAIGGLDGVSGQYALWSLTSPTPLPGAQWAAWLFSWPIQLVVPGGLLTLLVLTFPTGRFMSPRWRTLALVGLGLSALVAVTTMLADEPILVATEVPAVPNPTGIVSIGGAYGWVMGGALLGAGLVLVAAAAGLVLRFRRSREDERLQLKWFAFVVATTVGAMTALTVTVLVFLPDQQNAPWVSWSFNVILVGGFAVGLPVACGIAITKYRLYEIDVVISKTLVYGALAAFITAAYVGIVVGIGTVVGSGEEPNLGLQIAATALVALLFQPVRDRVQHVANRLVYGKRATPYEVLSRFSERMAATPSTEESLPRMARGLSEGTGAVRADVWLVILDELRPTASWPEGSAGLEPVALRDSEMPELPGASLALPVRHRGDLLGALTLVKPADERLTPPEERLAAQLAAQAGFVLRNVRLSEELRARVDELRTSRRRVVAAQDAGRRRLERDIHDGAQQQLVALSIKVRLAQRLAEKDPEKAEALLAGLEEEAQAALHDLRSLALGVYPQALAERGLAEALRERADDGPVPVVVEADELPRGPSEVEAAVYFCCLEALQNVAKYARASRAVVRLRMEAGNLRFEVEDDGVGFDPTTTPLGAGLRNIRDRLGAFGGDVEIHSVPGEGTRVSAWVLMRATAEDAAPMARPEPVSAGGWPA